MNRGHLCLAVGVLAFSVGCTAPAGAPVAPPRYRVVTTVAPITNIVRNVAGTMVDVQGIIPEGTDSHTFEPAPNDAVLLSQANLVLVNGLHLETPTEKLAETSVKPGTLIFRLGDHTVETSQWVFDVSFPQDKGNPNPHLWMNVPYARHYAELAAQQLSLVDPADEGRFNENLKRYQGLLDHLDAAITKAVATIPAAQRKLVTYHDSFAYFAPHYGMQVIAAVQPADFKEPSAQDMARVIDQLKRERVPAIFGSEVFPSQVLNQIGREAKVKYISTLRDDDLPGAPTDAQHTYVGMMLEDVRTMVTSLGGTPVALDGIRPDNTFSP